MSDKRGSPSGNLNSYTLLNLSGTAPALALAGDNSSFNITTSKAKVGDAGIVVCPTLAAAGVVVNYAICIVDGTIVINITATKAYGGGALTDVSVNMHKT